MSEKFPLMIDLTGNNCTVFGGGENSNVRIQVLLQFGAKVTVISPDICDEIRKLDKAGVIRYIPRKYYRGDCSTSYICIAATNNDSVNIAISDECKAKSIWVNVVSPSAFGTFIFPNIIYNNEITVALQCSDREKMTFIYESIEKILPVLLEKHKDDSK